MCIIWSIRSVTFFTNIYTIFFVNFFTLQSLIHTDPAAKFTFIGDLVSTNTLPAGGVNHTKTLGEQLRASTKTLPTHSVNHTDRLDEQLMFSTNTLPMGAMNILIHLVRN